MRVQQPRRDPGSERLSRPRIRVRLGHRFALLCRKKPRKVAVVTVETLTFISPKNLHRLPTRLSPSTEAGQLRDAQLGPHHLGSFSIPAVNALTTFRCPSEFTS